jgi:hypothetical protein
MERKCKRCGEIKDINDFHKCSSKKDGHHYTCKQCIKNNKKINGSRYDKEWKTKRKEYTLWRHAKYRANKKGIPFDITEQDIIIPEICPVLGILIMRNANRNSWNSPSLDRIIPEKGYVRGNIRVISWRANTIKSYGNAEEHRKIAEYIDECVKNYPIDTLDYSI